jgi:hypothetical protein
MVIKEANVRVCTVLIWIKIGIMASSYVYSKQFMVP